MLPIKWNRAIARRFHGDADRWPEIFAANKDRPQPDGRRLVDERRIDKGWKLTVAVPNRAIRAVDGALEYTVQPDDTLTRAHCYRCAFTNADACAAALQGQSVPSLLPVAR